jgi:hypothetical protein
MVTLSKLSLPLFFKGEMLRCPFDGYRGEILRFTQNDGNSKLRMAGKITKYNNTFEKLAGFG